MANGVEIMAQALAGIASGYMGQVAQRRKEQQEYRDRINYQQEIAQMEEDARVMREQDKLRRDRKDAELFSRILNPEQFATDMGTPAPVPETSGNVLMDILNRTALPSGLTDLTPLPTIREHDQRVSESGRYEVSGKGKTPKWLDPEQPISTGRFVEGTVEDAGKVREDALDELLQSNPTMYMNVISNLSESEQKAEAARLKREEALQPKIRLDLGARIWKEYPDGRLEKTELINPKFVTDSVTQVLKDGTRIKIDYNALGDAVNSESSLPPKNTRGSGSGTGNDDGGGYYTDGGGKYTKRDKEKETSVPLNSDTIKSGRSQVSRLKKDYLNALSDPYSGTGLNGADPDTILNEIQLNSKMSMGHLIPVLEELGIQSIRGEVFSIQKRYGGGNENDPKGIHKNMLKYSVYGVDNSDLKKELRLLGDKYRTMLEHKYGVGNNGVGSTEYSQMMSAVADYIYFALGVNFYPYLKMGSGEQNYKGN